VLFCGNKNPGPQDYIGNEPKGFSAKSWSTNIGAFGTTERKFASLYSEDNSMKPGPGSYSSNSFVQKKFLTKKMRG
jgi:hypothetical protein